VDKNKNNANEDLKNDDVRTEMEKELSKTWFIFTSEQTNVVCNYESRLYKLRKSFVTLLKFWVKLLG